MTNPYLRDAPYFLKRAIAGIATDDNGPENFSHALDLALGFERILKGILWNEHPAFTLLDESFENTVKVFHADRLKTISGESGEGKKKEANADSVTFRAATSRARIFSDAAKIHQPTLMKLGHIRDVVVHNDLTSLDSKDVAFYLRRNLHPLLTAFSAEGLLDAGMLMGSEEAVLRQFAIDYIEDLNTRVAKRLAYHLEIFRTHKISGKPFPNISSTPSSDEWDTSVECPACEQLAQVRQVVDFDYVDKQAMPAGTYISHLRCPYCGLLVEDFEELEEMGITEEYLGRDAE